MHVKINKIAEHDHEQYLSILRLTEMSQEMPISERLIAGKKYIDAGGNGDVKHYYENLVREHTEIKRQRKQNLVIYASIVQR